mmetsp:Transcript_25370/g.41737  ORF Transcript_25370/g.41737 Transcript_25370/m.41737 type:complete len:374 (-) Transcript_25370:592-1713(-)|eukprot:CAMPEP_0184659720 /NCGR_PEP_ID=MMETSP0308-20130426/30802_1 /TAXON_ID=38269 /ORGANISM="Gloeochaete witrockiana, Strain SAG 46.84" /LENGTH=373 /DNA_ID=CAMNT_0027099759 /DNA_START=118 /DNA_END=1239 /DNA_ORIENTATION=+
MDLPSWLKPEILWLVGWLGTNISSAILNKAAFQFAHFKYPLALSFIHMVCQSLFTFFFVRLGQRVPHQQLSRKEYLRIVMYAQFFALNIVIGNACLKYASVSFVRVTRSTVPIVAMFFTYFLQGKSYPLRVKLSLVPILIGATIATYGELEVGLSQLGLIFCVLACIFAALKAVLSNKYLTGNLSLHPLDLLDRTAPLAALSMLPFVFLAGEHKEVMTTWMDHATPNNVMIVFSTAVAALALNYTSFRLNAVTSAVALTVASNAKESLTIVLSFIIFQNKVTATGAIGTLMVLLSSIIYSREAARAKALGTLRDTPKVRTVTPSGQQPISPISLKQMANPDLQHKASDPISLKAALYPDPPPPNGGDGRQLDP